MKNNLRIYQNKIGLMLTEVFFNMDQLSICIDYN